MKRALALAALLFLSAPTLLSAPTAQGQSRGLPPDHSHVEYDLAKEQLHQLWGKIRATRLMQQALLFHIAKTEGVRTAETLLSITEKHFRQHVQMMYDAAKEDLSKSHWLSQGVGKELKRTTGFFEQGGRQHLRELRRVTSAVRATR